MKNLSNCLTKIDYCPSLICGNFTDIANDLSKNRFYTKNKKWQKQKLRNHPENFQDKKSLQMNPCNFSVSILIMPLPWALKPGEISWFVNYVTDLGLIYLKRNGGVDPSISPAQRVLIHGKKGPVKAVFGWPAIHTRHGDDKKDPQPKVENLWLDCGARNKKEVEQLGIHIGAVVTYKEGFDELANNNFIGRAFDNRIGGFMIAEVARLLKKNNKKLPYGLYVVNAVQEEIGLRGAEMIARRIKPNIAIVTDVTHDTTTPLINKNIEGDVSCGKGPSLSYAPAVHNKLLALVEKVATDKKIPLQWRALSRSTGTDTDSFAYSNDGCPSVLISIPLRYMHTPVEMIHRDDIETTIQLMYETLLTLTPKTNLSYM